MTTDIRGQDRATASLRRQLDHALKDLFAAMDRVNGLRRELRAQQVSVPANVQTRKRQRRRSRR